MATINRQIKIIHILEENYIFYNFLYYKFWSQINSLDDTRGWKQKLSYAHSATPILTRLVILIDTNINKLQEKIILKNKILQIILKFQNSP